MKKYRINRRRPVAALTVCALLFASVFGRLYAVSKEYAEPAAGERVGMRTVVLGKTRGYIYDRNMTPLVNTEKRNCVMKIGGDNGPVEVSAAVGDEPESDSVKTVTLVGRTNGNPLCAHVIGYLDGQGRGVCGIEKSFDRILNEAEGTLGVRFMTNGLGQAIAGAGVEIVNDGYDNPAGVVLTIDADVQRIAENALARSSIETGAIVVLDVQTFEILALASVPVYDVNDLAASLNDENAPFLNRALSAYPVGSVFKPFVAAAAMEYGVDTEKTFTCEGSVTVGGVTFPCYHSTAHGELDLSGAVCRSCNGYFIDLAQYVGAENLTAICKLFGFGTRVKLTGDIVNAAGNLPDAAKVDSAPSLANLSFGQGELLATPLQLAAAYAVIANGGEYREPTLLKYLVDDRGEMCAYFQSDVRYPVLKSETCEALARALALNMLEGTGRAGASTLVSSAGKTATAQTGIYRDDGTERLCTWFCGFAPYEEPRYSVVVFNENGSAASVDCAPVFLDLIEALYDAEMFE